MSYRNNQDNTFGPAVVEFVAAIVDADPLITDNLTANTIFLRDFDGNGSLDIITHAGNISRVSFYANDGAGNFSAFAIPSLDGNIGPGGSETFALADVNGDNIDDAILSAFTTSSFTNTIRWFAGDGAGGFGPAQLIDNVLSNRIRAFDVDADSDIDVVAFTSNGAVYYENDGTGVFALSQPIADNLTVWFDHRNDTGNFDTDTDTDVLIGTENGELFWYENPSGSSVNGLTITATDGVFEDRVEINWSFAGIVPMETVFQLSRNNTPIYAAAAAQLSYIDFTADIGVEYVYCLDAITNAGTTQVCDDGTRAFRPPSSFNATDFAKESGVDLTWVDNSLIEDGYEISRRQTTEVNPDTTFMLGANEGFFFDDTGVPGQTYEYCLVAVKAPNLITELRCDEGTRALVTAPANVQATDGQYADRVRVTWTDQSVSEDGFVIFRFSAADEGGFFEIAQVGPNVTRYDDLEAAQIGDGFIYRVFAIAGGVLSSEFAPGIQDDGTLVLQGVDSFTATNGNFDDRVSLSWTYSGPTVDVIGFELQRDGVPVDTIAVNLTSYDDFTAPPGVSSQYSIRTYAEPADATGPGFSASSTATGLRSFVLPPAELTATDGTLEDRVDLNWTSEGSTVLLHKVYRGVSTGSTPDFANTLLIATTALDIVTYSDFLIESDVVYDYCVTTVTLEGFSGASAVQQEVTSFIASTSESLLSGKNLNEQERNAAAKTIETGAMDLLESMNVSSANLQESIPDCDQGSRSLIPPTQVAATDDAEETNVQITWVDQSSAEKGFIITRTQGNMTAVVDTVSNTRDSVRDFGGIPGVNYTYKVFAYDEYATNMFGVSVEGTYAVSSDTTGRRTLLPPSDVSATDGTSETEVTITWLDESRAESGYEIRRALVNTTNFTVLDTVLTGTEYVDATAQLGSEYIYGVSAVDSLGASEAREDRGSLAVLYPVSVSASDEYTTEVIVTWVEASGLGLGYDVYRNDVLIQEDVLAGDVDFSDTTGAADLTYTYCVVPANQPISDSRTECDTGVKLSAPQGTAAFIATTASDGQFVNQIQVTWDDVLSDEAGFIVFRENEEGITESIGSVTANVTLFNDRDVAPGGAYKYCVLPYTAGNEPAPGTTYETTALCDTGWLPPNGAISGRVSAPQGGPTGDVVVSLSPNPNKALLLDGVGGFAEIPHDTELNLDITGSYTLELWARFTGTAGAGASANASIVEKGLGGESTVFPFAIRALRTGQIQFLVDDGAGAVSIQTSAQYNNNQWNHIAAVYNATTQQIQLFINGESAGVASTAGKATWANTDPIYLGQRGLTNIFGGQIDDFRIWNVARTQAEIAANNSMPLQGEETNLIGYWPLDQGVRRVITDISSSANHGMLTGGIHWSSDGAPLMVSAITDNTGNFTLDGIRYGDGTTFTVTPSLLGRIFTPARKTITLNTQSPVQNELDFLDESAFTVSGRVLFGDGSCPAEGIELYVAEGLGGEEELVGDTESDGTFALSVAPSSDNNDIRRIIPRFTPGANPHTFDPVDFTYVATQDTAGILFRDRATQKLVGQYSGGGATCNEYVGDIILTITTENGCFLREERLTSVGNFEFDLPPQQYLVSAEVDLQTVPGYLDAADVFSFFDDLGQQFVDLTVADDTLDFIYRAPLSIQVTGFPAPKAACSTTGISVVDNQGNPAGRVLPNVPVIGENVDVPLTISVAERYGVNTCAVDAGSITIRDGLSVTQTDTTITLQNGTATYTARGEAPDIIAGRVIDGIDRSFQKPFTVRADVEGRAPTTVTDYVIVEGFLERTAQFVSATTGNIPLLILHDPPGSQSYAYLEENTTVCTNVLNLQVDASESGLYTNLGIGFKLGSGGPFVSIDNGAGVEVQVRTLNGRSSTSLLGPGNTNGFEICATTTQKFATSDDPSAILDDIIVGTALNLIFAKTDIIDFEAAGQNACTIQQSEGLATDLDSAEPFETTYVYSESSVETFLIPDLQALADLAGGEATIEGELDGELATIKLTDAITNWQKVISDNAKNIENGLVNPIENRSFSGGLVFEASTLADTTTITQFSVTSVYDREETEIGAIRTILGYDQRIGRAGEILMETTREFVQTQQNTTEIGWVFDDGDGGDLFTVDVGVDPVYSTPVFGVLSGRSSNPCESATQCRDMPVIEVAPFEQLNAGTEETVVFTATATNLSESEERREYVIAAPTAQNPGGASIYVNGQRLGSPGSGNAQTILLDYNSPSTLELLVERGPNAFSHDSLAIIMYPKDEYEIWRADFRGAFARSDSAFFSISYDVACTPVDLVTPNDVWRFTAGDNPINLLIGGYNLDPQLVNNDLSTLEIGARYRLEGTPDWIKISDSIAKADTLSSNNIMSYVASWTPILDGDYELQAYSECATPSNVVVSPPVKGTVDTAPFMVLGSPEPGDGSLALGDVASVTFNEEIACSSIDAQVGTANVEIRRLGSDGVSVVETLTSISAVCDGRTLVVEPSGGWNDTHEGNRFEVAVLSTQNKVPSDVNGNTLPSDLAWQFVVQRSGFAFNPVNIVKTVSSGVFSTLDVSLVNGRPDPLQFSITDSLSLALLDANGVATSTVAKILPSDTLGLIPGNGTYPISFRVPDTLALGNWKGSISALGSVFGISIGEVPLQVELEVGCAIPAWTVNPANYLNSMSLVAQLELANTLSDDTADLVAAFVGNEVRGVAFVDSVTPASNRVRMTIYSNVTSGETVTFKAFDTSNCLEYPGTVESIPFAANTVTGTEATPQPLNASLTPPQQVVALNAGWTWISINRTPSNTAIDSVLSTVNPANGDIVKSQTEFSLYDETSAGWVGTLSALAAPNAYQIKLTEASMLTVNGVAIDPATTDIAIAAGWNWIGYLPVVSQDVNTALGSLTATMGDLIKSQTQFALYDGTNWVGSLKQLVPGQGYLLFSASGGTLTYPAGTSSLDVGGTIASKGGFNLGAASPGDVSKGNPEREAQRIAGKELLPGLTFVPEAFSQSMTVVAEIEEGGIVLEHDGVGVWAVDSEGIVRGVAEIQYLESAEAGRVFLMLYGEEAEDEALTLNLFDTAKGMVTELASDLVFQPNQRLGSIDEPITIITEADRIAREIPDEFELMQNYPNPFNPTTTIQYALPQDAEVKLIVYDTLGREVMTLVDKEQKAGRYTLQFDASSLASGIYFYQIEAASFTKVHKMTLVK